MLTSVHAAAATGDPGFRSELAAALTNNALHLIVLPTEQCNFRCTYCYEDFKIGRMKPPTVQGIKRLIDTRIPELTRLNLSWFGGEPMLALKIVEDISAHIVNRARDLPDLDYEAEMTTNGYFLDAGSAAMLAELGVKTFQVSLDGPISFHDASRIRANGTGSFVRIWDNLTSIRESEVQLTVILRVHLTPENLPAMPAFLSTLREEFLRDPRFVILLRPIEHMGGPNDSTLEVLPEGARTAIIHRLQEILVGDGRGPSVTYQAPSVCYASRANSLVIRADSSISKCTVALSDPANNVGRLKPDGTLEIRDERFAPWLRGWASGDLDAVACPYIGIPRPSKTPVQIGSRSDYI